MLKILRGEGRRLVAVMFISISAALLLSPLLGRQGATPEAPKLNPAPSSIREDSQTVLVGMHVLDVYSVDPTNGTFMCNFYIWWKWRGTQDPSRDWQLINSSDPQSHMSRVYSYVDEQGAPKPHILPDGQKYQFATVAASLVVPFNYSHFPFDRQTFSIDVESAAFNQSELQYVVDGVGATVDPSANVHGWRVHNVTETVFTHHYATTFGFAPGAVEESDYSLVRTSFTVERPTAFGIWKLFLPMLVVIIVGLSALLVHSTRFEERLALSGSSLLALIFLQQGYTANLPTPTPLVLMDKVYALAYLVTVIAVGRVIWVTNTLSSKQNERENQLRDDVTFAFALLLAFVIGCMQLLHIN